MRSFTAISALLVVLAFHHETSCGAAAKDDSPQQVIGKFIDAMAQGDAKSAESLCIAGENELRWIRIQVPWNAARKRLASVADTKFGESGKIFMHKALIEVWRDALKDAKLEQKEDSAELRSKPDIFKGFRFVRKDGVWKLDLVTTLAATDRIDEAFYKRAAANSNIVADGIETGKYKTAQEAHDDLRTRNMSGLSADDSKK